MDSYTYSNGEKKDDKILHSSSEFDFELPVEWTVLEYILRRTEDNTKKGIIASMTNSNTTETCDFTNVEDIAEKIASALYKRGMRKGDTLIYSSHHGTKLHLFFLGVWRANGIVRSSYPEDTGETLTERILESKARWFLCDESHAYEVTTASKKVPWQMNIIVFGQADGCVSAEDILNDDGLNIPSLDIGREDVALILPTSGTSGASKGAVYTHENLLKNIVAFEHFPFTDSDEHEKPFLITSKLTHFTGCVIPFAFIARGRRIFFMPHVTVENVLETIEEFKIYALLSFPKYITGLINHPSTRNYNLSSLTYITTGGQTVTPTMNVIIKRLKSLRHFLILYGMTEAGLLTATVNWTAELNGCYKPLEYRPFTVGTLPPGSSMQVIDLKTGCPVGPGEKGELYFKTPFSCSEYFRRPKETEETFHNGWLRTGDVGYIDKDGFIYVLDRAKEIFKYFNNHISPSELENVLLRHPDVTETCVVGVPDPDGGDFIPRAFVVLRKSSQANVEEIKKFFNCQVASYKHLRGGLYIVSQIPVGKTGKTVRRLTYELSMPKS